MASAYATFASGGIKTEPELLRKVADRKGNTIVIVPPKASTKVFDGEPLAELVDLMQDVVRFGSGHAAQLTSREVAGKTGTSDQAKDLWFVGFTPDLVTATWGGNDENAAIPGTSVTGGSVMAAIWRDYTSRYYLAHPTLAAAFPSPATPMIHELPVLATTTLPPTTDPPIQNQPPANAVQSPERRASFEPNVANQSKQVVQAVQPSELATEEKTQAENKKGILSKFGHFFKKIF
jgi:penicillin-binding protein 1A